MKAPVRPRIRDEIWGKIWGNLSFNPISALTHATLDVLRTDPGTRSVARGMMLEAQDIAEKLGVRFPFDVERRIDGGAAVGAHRTSMWQDLDAGHPGDIEASGTSVQELGRLARSPAPGRSVKRVAPGHGGQARPRCAHGVWLERHRHLVQAGRCVGVFAEVSGQCLDELVERGYLNQRQQQSVGHGRHPKHRARFSTGRD